MKTKLAWLILSLGLFLRLPLLNGSFWLDEAAQALESSRPLSQQFDIIPDFQPPLLHLILHFALYVSSAEWWLRLVGALIPGLITIWATYKIGERLHSEITGFLAALLLSTSSFHIFYSQELRPYSLPAMFGALSWLVLRDWQDSRLRWPVRAFLLGILTALGLYSSFLYPFLIVSQFIFIWVFYREKVSEFVAPIIGAGIAFLPWLPTFFKQLNAGGAVRTDLPGWEEVVSIPQLKSIPMFFGKFLYGVVDLELNWVFILCALLIGSLTSFLLCDTYKQHIARRSLAVCLLWCVIPLLTSWLISFLIPVVQPKRLLFSLPAFYLLLSTIITSQFARYKRLAYTLVGLLLIINLYGTVQYYTNPQLQREDWRSLHGEISRLYSSESAIAVFSFPEPFAPWVWYDDGQFPTYSTGTLSISQVQSLTQDLKQLTNYELILVFDYLRDLTDPTDQLLREIEAFGYRHIDTLDSPNIGFVRVYAKPESVVGWGLPEDSVIKDNAHHARRH